MCVSDNKIPHFFNLFPTLHVFNIFHHYHSISVSMCESITETTERDNGTKTTFLYDTDF